MEELRKLFLEIGYTEEETLHELNKLIVKWVISNPNQIELKEIKYRR